jgi:uncharacterized protein
VKGLTDRFGLEVLDEDECFELMSTQEVGRLAVVSGGVPLIFPVNFAVANGNIVIRTAPGTKLTAAGRNQVTIEADEIDPATHTGWSVVVRGRAEEITDFDPADIRGLRHIALNPWAGDKPVWLRIVPAVITGRRLLPGPPRRTSVGDPGWRDEPAWPVPVDDERARWLASGIVRVDHPAEGAAGAPAHEHRHAAFAMVDAEGRRLALASYEGPLTSDEVDLSLVLAPESGEDGVEAGALLVRRLAAVAYADGARRIVVDYDLLIADVAESLALTGFPWTVHHQDRSARAELALPVDD